MKVIWLSSNRFGYELLSEAMKIKNNGIKAIITLADDAKSIMYDGIDRQKWLEFGIDIFEINAINDEKNLLKKLAPDIVIMCGWRQIVDKDILKIPKNGFAGFHPTLLPKGRGPAPVINTILQDFKESGVTFFHVTSGLDDGDIIGQEKFHISRNDYAEDVYNKAIIAGKKLVAEQFPLLLKGKAKRKKQDNSKATIFKKPELKDNQIDLEKEDIEMIYKKIRALSKPYLGAYVEKDGKKLIIWKGELK